MFLFASNHNNTPRAQSSAILSFVTSLLPDLVLAFKDKRRRRGEGMGKRRRELYSVEIKHSNEFYLGHTLQTEINTTAYQRLMRSLKSRSFSKYFNENSYTPLAWTPALGQNRLRNGGINHFSEATKAYQSFSYTRASQNTFVLCYSLAHGPVTLRYI